RPVCGAIRRRVHRAAGDRRSPASQRNSRGDASLRFPLGFSHSMRIGVVRETVPGERRVALVPETVGRLAKSGNEVVVERGAGEASSFPDRMYTDAGASIGDAWSADLVAKVAKPSDDELGRLREGAVLIAFLQPLTNHDLVRALARRRITALSMDAVPRLTQAQPMDALSSQATVAEYKAVLPPAVAIPN